MFITLLDLFGGPLSVPYGYHETYKTWRNMIKVLLDAACNYPDILEIGSREDGMATTLSDYDLQAFVPPHQQVDRSKVEGITHGLQWYVDDVVNIKWVGNKFKFQCCKGEFVLSVEITFFTTERFYDRQNFALYDLYPNFHGGNKKLPAHVNERQIWGIPFFVGDEVYTTSPYSCDTNFETEKKRLLETMSQHGRWVLYFLKSFGNQDPKTYMNVSILTALIASCSANKPDFQSGDAETVLLEIFNFLRALEGDSKAQEIVLVKNHNLHNLEILRCMSRIQLERFFKNFGALMQKLCETGFATKEGFVDEYQIYRPDSMAWRKIYCSTAVISIANFFQFPLYDVGMSLSIQTLNHLGFQTLFYGRHGPDAVHFRNILCALRYMRVFAGTEYLKHLDTTGQKATRFIQNRLRSEKKRAEQVIIYSLHQILGLDTDEEFQLDRYGNKSWILDTAKSLFPSFMNYELPHEKETLPLFVSYRDVIHLPEEEAMQPAEEESSSNEKEKTSVAFSTLVHCEEFKPFTSHT